MCIILLDKKSWHRLALLKRQNIDEQTPNEWHKFVEKLSIQVSGKPSERFKLLHLLSNSHCLFSWHLSLETILMALGGKRLIFNCWGLPSTRSWWKKLITRFVLRRATYVLVNDEITKNEVKLLAGVDAKIVPFYVDVDFFNYSPMTNRRDFLFCPGSNDRNPEVLLELAKRGFKVTWLVNDKDLKKKYTNQHPNFKIVSHISFEDLRKLYQTCAMVILPLVKDDHAAGQTSTLESISCGTPVIISAGRSAHIFSAFHTIYPITSLQIEQWVNRINMLMMNSNPNLQTLTNSSSNTLSIKLHSSRMYQLYCIYFK